MAAGGGIAACAPRTPLRIALNPWPGYEFLRAADASGRLPRELVQLRETAVLEESAAALRRGEVDAAGVTLDEVLRLRAAGQNVQVVLVFDVSVGADALLASPGIASLAALRGRRIGVERTTLATLVLDAALAAGGLARTDVVLVPIDGDHVAAFDHAGLDAIVTYQPAPARLRGRGLVPLFDSRRLPQLIVDTLAVHARAVAVHGQALRAAIAAHFDALRRWQLHPLDFAYVLGSQLRVAAEDVADLYRGLDLPDALYNRAYLTPPAAELTRAALELQRLLALDARPGGARLLDGLFLPDFLPGDQQ